MDTFFLQHNVLQDRDSDEMGGQTNSDSDVTDDPEDMTKRVQSVADPTGPWKQRTVTSETWGKPTRGLQGRGFASSHTGPKGVMNDYKAHKRNQKEERQREEAKRHAVLNRITKGAVVPVAPFQQKLKVKCDQGSESDSSDMEEEDPFLVQYAAMRVQQMQQVARRRKIYGDFEYITPEQFVKLTGSVAARKMLVHLYHPENYACSLLNTQLEQLAPKLVHVKFAAMVAKEADASIATADLPVVLIFRSPQQQEAVVDVTRRLDGEFTFDRVEAFVKKELGLSV